MMQVYDYFISIRDIRKIHYEIDNTEEYLVITYAYDSENPTRIPIHDHNDYISTAELIMEQINERKDF